MTPLVHLVMLGWIPGCIWLFSVLPLKRAILGALITGWLFLPIASYKLSGLPNYNKTFAICLGVFLGVLLFDRQTRFKWRFQARDLPIVVWCVCPILTSLNNGLGIHDGLSGAFQHAVFWGLPYALGRAYFSDSQGIRDLALAFFIGGLIYIPFCLFEMRMSPKLHKMFYGFHQAPFAMTKRLGGYRPMVFLHHGIALGLWMAMSSTVGIWLWRTRALQRLRGIKVAYLALSLLLVALLCRSLGAIVLLGVALAALFLGKRLRSSAVLAVLLAMPVSYCFSRGALRWDGSEIINIARHLNPDRVYSLEGRLFHERRLLDKASRRPILGWGGWGRNRVYDDYGNDTSVTDGYWIIVLGQRGLTGLTSVGLVMLLPIAVVWRRVRGKEWAAPEHAAPVALAVALAIFAIDRLFNAMPNVICTVVMGALIGPGGHPAEPAESKEASRRRYRVTPVASGVEGRRR